ncbi:ectoine/hydroxyectoine ABC transporter substrate-binding protein EhuB [Desulfobulbus rhabdoformis]|uniref:ectoine/hydroxyectoine ABC transporter substrate-binding protein EhuB n=1 Tax=Desulfobulbus rhabdoformis TaxID=34032 RepID=UPI001964A084|nr:ectoine/hydroxyectoine ABC transporter substrate-binding protein EhuB [Desulfobulbus rhabdoformis]MBM9615337.1 ectoine/hydroxyectoine ABC transporter substrate-binding protein EhuB [Desulfobulbus rhabdoformis]
MDPKQYAAMRGNRGIQPSGPSSYPRSWSISLAAVLLLLAITLGINTFFTANESTAERVARTQVVRIGYAVEAPFAFTNAEETITGESPEVARAVWQRLGIKRIEWIRTDFGSLIPQLRAGRFDQIASGLFIRPDREKLVAFTTPSLCFTPALLVHRGNPLNLHSYADIALHEKAHLAVIQGAVEREEALRSGVPLQRIVTYPNVLLALDALRNNLVDGLSLSSPTIRRLAEENSDLQQATPFAASYTPPGCSAFAFRKQDAALRQRFDQALRQFLGSSEHMQILESIGLDAYDLPSSISFDKRES